MKQLFISLLMVFSLGVQAQDLSIDKLKIKVKKDSKVIPLEISCFVGGAISGLYDDASQVGRLCGYKDKKEVFCQPVKIAWGTESGLTMGIAAKFNFSLTLKNFSGKSLEEVFGEYQTERNGVTIALGYSQFSGDNSNGVEIEGHDFQFGLKSNWGTKFNLLILPMDKTSQYRKTFLFND